MFTSVCNYSRYVSEYARGSISPLCSKVMGQVTRETSKFVDKYDVTLDVCISSVLSQSKRLSPQVSPILWRVCTGFHCYILAPFYCVSIYSMSPPRQLMFVLRMRPWTIWTDEMCKVLSMPGLLESGDGMFVASKTFFPLEYIPLIIAHSMRY